MTDPAPAHAAPDPLALLRRHEGLLRRIAWAWSRDDADRDDVLQEIAVQLWRVHGRIDPRLREASFVARVALNVAISFQRRERRHRTARVGVDVDHLAAAGPGPVERDDERERLRAAIDSLRDLDRALALLHLEGHDHAAIGEVLGISAANVATKWWRIKARLRERLVGGATEDGR